MTYRAYRPHRIDRPLYVYPPARSRLTKATVFGWICALLVLTVSLGVLLWPWWLGLVIP
jgi:hypothetical protein